MAHSAATHDIPCRDFDCVFLPCVNSKLDGMMKRGSCGTGQFNLLTSSATMSTSCPEKFDLEGWWKDLHGILQLSAHNTRTTSFKELERGGGILDSQPCQNLEHIQTDQTVSDTNQATHKEANVMTNDRSIKRPENSGNPPPYCNSFRQNRYSAAAQATSLRPYQSVPNIAMDNHLIPNAKAGNIQASDDGKPQVGVKPLNNSLCRILSLLFQALGSWPTTAELEMLYVRVLENAYAEIKLLQATSTPEQTEQIMCETMNSNEVMW